MPAAHAQLARVLRHPRVAFTIETYLTPCIVSSPPQARCFALINPGNEEMVGTALPYFPMPRKPPPGLETSTWSGMEAGSGMFYPSQVVDGKVTLLGGAAYAAACRDNVPETGVDGVRCPTGQAVLVPAAGELRDKFEIIVHAVPPLPGKAWRHDLHRAWRSALEVAMGAIKGEEKRGGGKVCVAAPLLGAGARRRFPGQDSAEAMKEAAAVAAAAMTAEEGGGDGSMGDDDDQSMAMCFGLLEGSVEASLARELEQLGWVNIG